MAPLWGSQHFQACWKTFLSVHHGERSSDISIEWVFKGQPSLHLIPVAAQRCVVLTGVIFLSL